LDILNEVEKVVQETPPVDNAASRFGNPAFKTFYDKVEQVSYPRYQFAAQGKPTTDHSQQQRSEAMHQKLVSAGLLEDEDAIPELRVYFNESWGNRTRIDYGSGMELNFLCWL
jgi:serine/threonine-protein phosphatase 2A activator